MILSNPTVILSQLEGNEWLLVRGRCSSRATGRPAPLARYTQANGFLYLALGLLIYAWPRGMALVGAGAFEGQESGLFRTIGLAIAIIGWFYVFGARTNRDTFGLATFGDRILVPAFVLPLVFAGQVDPMLVLPVAILDPILGIGAFVIWKRQSTF